MRMSKKVLFLGTPEFALASLKVVHQYADLVGVVTQPDRPFGRKLRLKPSAVADLASKWQVPVFKCSSSKAILEETKALQADCALVVAYGQILTQAFLEAFPLKVVNLHASLLPRWRGAAPIQRALMTGDAFTGVCLQQMVKQLDAGPLLDQQKVQIPEDMMADQLSEILSKMGGELVKDVFLKYLKGDWKTWTEQQEHLVTYAPKLTKKDGLIDFGVSAQEIFNKYRGLCVWPQVWIKRSGHILKIKKMTYQKEKLLKGLPGQVVSISRKAITVACGEGSVDILQVQPESRKSMTSDEYVRGYSVRVGENWQ